jgi:uncharacterized membrane protein
VHFTITPRDTWWWDQNAGGWTQTAGVYRVYVGDSSALADLPLRNTFDMTSTPGARQVTVSAPSAMQPGHNYKVTVKLTAGGGNEALNNVRLALQLPQGWTQGSLTRTVFRSVAPGQPATAKFLVTPPSWFPNTNDVVHATADLSPDAQREAGVTVTVG